MATKKLRRIEINEPLIELFQDFQYSTSKEGYLKPDLLYNTYSTTGDYSTFIGYNFTNYYDYVLAT